jgi:hypothetical protein
MADDQTRRRVQREFLQLLEDNELPPPDEIWWEEESTLFRWHEPKVVICLDPDETADEPPDAIKRAIIGGVAYGDWPVAPS